MNEREVLTTALNDRRRDRCLGWMGGEEQLEYCVSELYLPQLEFNVLDVFSYTLLFLAFF